MSWGKTASNWVNAMAGCFFFFSVFIFVLWREREYVLQVPMII